VLRLAVGVLTILPRRLALWLGEQAGWLARLLHVRRGTVRCNLTAAGYAGDEHRRIERRLYRQMGRYMVDAMRGGKIPFHVAEGSDTRLDQGERSNNGLLLLFSHLGNWEQLLIYLSGQPFLAPATIVAKPMHNPMVNRWLERERAARAPGIAFVPPQNALRQSLRSLRAGGTAAFAIDQYGGSTGLPSQFLGQRTSTVRSTAGLERKTGCRVVGAYALLESDNSYRIVVDDLPPAEADATVPDLLDRHNELISGWIRQYPEHWFGWFHRRFRDVVEYG
jgi:lauroyl/myristoyl acyltransferase